MDVPLTSRVLRAAARIEKVLSRRLQAVCFYPTEACPLACAWCNAEHRGNRSIEPERALRFLHDAKDIGLEAVDFTGGGEPLAHANIALFVERAQALGYRTSLVTNGVLLHTFPRELLARMTWIRVSINAGRGLYEKVHGRAHWPLVIENVKEYVGPLKGVKRSVSCVWSDLNTVDDLAELAWEVHKAGIPTLRIAPEIYSNKGVPSCPIPAEAIHLVGLPAELQVIIETPRATGQPAQCFTQWYKPVLDADGNIYPCTLAAEPVCTIETMKEHWLRGRDRINPPIDCEWCHFSDANHFLSEVTRAEAATDLAFM